MTDTWRNLAELTGPCPECRGSGHIYQPVQPVGNEELDCPTCHGTSQVPLMPGLSKLCEACKGAGTRYHPRFGGPPLPEDAYQCPNCDGTGRLPVSGPEAIVAAMEFILNQPAPGNPEGFWSLEMEHDNAGYYVYIRTWPPATDDWQVQSTGEGSTLESALAQALERALGAYVGEGEAMKPTIVCLCGSGRFREAFERAEYEETLAGKIVLTIGCNAHDVARSAELAHHKPMLDTLHLRKIDLADEVLILNVGGYIGESTNRELAYARANGKVIRFLERAMKEKP